jgi:hypothetical protein
MMYFVRGRMVDEHTLKSSSSVWSRDLFLLFIVFIAEKPASHRHDLEKGSSASITYFVMMEHSCRTDNQNESFSCSLLSCHISGSSSSSAAPDYEDSNALNTYDLSPSARKIHLWEPSLAKRRPDASFPQQRRYPGCTATMHVPTETA